MDPSSDHSIPLLTEIITASTEPTAALPNEQQLQQIRQDVYENVMQDLLKQIDIVLHQHLQDHLAVILDNMADILKTRVRTSLEQALATTVEQAVVAEISKFEKSKN